MHRRLRLAALPLAAAALVLAGCGQTPTTTPPAGSASPAPSASAAPSSAEPSAAETSSPSPADASASSSASSSPSSSPSTSSSGSEDLAVADPCTVISQSKMEDLVHADLGKGKLITDKKLEKTCQYDLTSDGRTLAVTGIAFNIGSVSKQLEQLDLENAKVKKLDLEGFDEAAWVNTKISGLTSVGVVGQKGAKAYIAFLAGLKSDTTYREYGEKIVAELAKG